MTIEIVNTATIEDARQVTIILTTNGNSYLWNVGGLPLVGNLQTILEGREAELLAAILAAGMVANVAEIEVERTPGAVRAWFTANPSAKLIWSMTVAEVVAEIASLVDTSFSGLPPATRTKWKLLLTAIVLVVKIYVKRERLD